MTVPMITYQLTFSTADEEARLFYGQIGLDRPRLEAPRIQPGTYRVVDGQLFLVLPGMPVPTK